MRNLPMNRHHRLFLRRNKKKILILLGIILSIIVFFSLQGSAQSKIISPIPDSEIIKEAGESAKVKEPTPTITPTPTAIPTPKPMYEGKVSYYSVDGCLGCSENLTMGNGETFDEEAMTIAIPCEDIISKKHRYNTYVRVENVDTGESVEAKVTDCGGFSKYNRVADVSKGIYKALKIKTDVTKVKIVVL